jgi:dipeptidyl aminopeptidase/acylaminoacyl peptidase
MFITHEQFDGCVPSANSLALYAALTAHRVPATLLLTEGDTHGSGLGANLPWGAALLAWLAGHR